MHAAAKALLYIGSFCFKSMLVLSNTLNDIASSVVIGCTINQTELEAERGIGKRHHQTLGWTLSVAPNQPQSYHSPSVHHRWVISAHPNHSTKSQSAELHPVIGQWLLLVKHISNPVQKLHPVVRFLVASSPQARLHWAKPLGWDKRQPISQPSFASVVINPVLCAT